MLTQSAQELENRYHLDVYAKLPIAIERGEGCYVFDSGGRRLLDMYGGHCVTSTGHCHPRVAAAISEQASRLIFYSNATYSSIRGAALEKLLGLCHPFHQAVLLNSGAEANENAIKLARALTGRREVLSVRGSFHGRTYGALSATGIDQYRTYLNTPVPDHRILEGEAIPETVSDQTAAVLVEPIQSMGGVVVLDPGLLRRIEDVCNRHGALLIFDEIQTGIGRTGAFLYSQKIGVTPHLTSLAKGIASGYSAAALLVSEQCAARVKKGDLGTTFGGSPLACAAIRATLEVIEEESLVENAARMGQILRDRIEAMPGVHEVRGEGLLLGIVFEAIPAREVQRKIFERGILAGTSSDPAVLRLMSALTLGESESEFFCSTLESVLA